MKKRRGLRRNAFTLVELLVVIAIIALLLAALLPAFSVVKKNARVAQTQSMFQALSAGIESFRAEQSLGAGLPPSSSDNKAAPQSIAAPNRTEVAPVRAAGANLLALAMMGYDGLGTPGFKDSTDSDAEWWNNQHKGDDGGLYAMDAATGKEKHTRYGPYVDEKMREKSTNLKVLFEKGRVISDPGVEQTRAELPFFVDGFDLPILYYKASPASNLMVYGGTDRPGIYRQEDNGVITGTVGGETEAPGIDFGAGQEADAQANQAFHFIKNAKRVEAGTQVSVFDADDWKDTFARYILDPKAKARPTPVQRDSFLLISAGPDARYGTADDVTNWTRETN